jgi:hypothetical protein
MNWSITQRDDIYFVNIFTEEKWVGYSILNSNTIRIYTSEKDDDYIDVIIPEFLPKEKGTIYSYYDSQNKDVITIVYIPFSAGNMPREILNSETYYL